MASPNPFLAGLLCRCPRCGKGPVFCGFLKVCERCATCGLDLSKADSGDGPVVFILLIVGAIGCFGILFTEMAFHPPIWLELLFWMPAIGGLSLAALRPFKSTMIALQIHNAASEAGRETKPDE